MDQTKWAIHSQLMEFLTGSKQENHYYPFGMNHKGRWYGPEAPENRRTYNGKEYTDELGLDWHDYGARWYDAALGRFTGVDPIADQFAWVSSYNYAENEPVGSIDLHGLQAVRTSYHRPLVYSPKGERLNRPRDLLSRKMLVNLIEGVKAGSFQFLEVLSFGRLGREGNVASDSYHDSPRRRKRDSGVELLSDEEKMANGTLQVDEAEEAPIITSGEVLPPSEAGIGISDAVGDSDVNRALYYGGMSINQIRALRGNSSQPASTASQAQGNEVSTLEKPFIDRTNGDSIVIHFKTDPKTGKQFIERITYKRGE